MSPATTRSPSPRGLQRALLRLPTWLYRLRLGRLLGDRFVMLTHIGRRSGQLRQTVLEVVHHDRADDTYYVASGWGEKSDWLRNIQRRPDVLLDTSQGRYPATTERLAVEEAARVLYAYAQRHPRAFRQLGPIMLGQPVEASEQGCRQLAQAVPVVAIRHRGAQASQPGGAP